MCVCRDDLPYTVLSVKVLNSLKKMLERHAQEQQEKKETGREEDSEKDPNGDPLFFVYLYLFMLPYVCDIQYTSLCTHK